MKLLPPTLEPDDRGVVMHADVPGAVHRPIVVGYDLGDAPLVPDVHHFQREECAENTGVKVHIYSCWNGPAHVAPEQRDIFLQAPLELLLESAPVSNAVSFSANQPGVCSALSYIALA